MTDDGRTVREVGEFGLIAALRAALPPATVADPSLVLGIGDDAALWTPTPGETLVITADGLSEGVHFRLDWTDWTSLGHKAMAVNLSDLAAMGAVPRLVTLTLGLRGTERVADLEDLYRGAGALAAAHGVLVAGGDVVASPAGLALHVTALGETRAGRALTRGGARAGDLVAVSGALGAAAAGLRLLQAGSGRPRATTADLLLAAHLRPRPRVVLGGLLLDHGASAAMDLSDGLFGDLPKLLAASGVAARLDAAAIPIPAAVRALFPADWFALGTRGGEDYELLFTIAPDAFGPLRGAAAAIGATLTAIGDIVPVGDGRPSLLLLDADGTESAVAAGAFDHFAG